MKNPAFDTGSPAMAGQTLQPPVQHLAAFYMTAMHHSDILYGKASPMISLQDIEQFVPFIKPATSPLSTSSRIRALSNGPNIDLSTVAIRSEAEDDMIMESSVFSSDEPRWTSAMLSYIQPGDHIFRFMDHRSEFFWPTIIDILVEQKLFLNSRTRFNDPYDSCPIIEDDLDVASAQSYLNEMVDNPSNSLLEPDQVAQLLKACGGTAPVVTPQFIVGISEQMRIYAAKFNDLCGLVSFSLSPENRLVWAHYAAGFSGVCVDFRRSTSPKSILALCARVVYVDQPPRLPLSLIHHLAINRVKGKSVDEISEQICFLSFLHKARDWDYEREVRICYPLVSNTKYVFAPDELVGLIVGPKASTDLEQQLRTLSSNLPQQLRLRDRRFPKPISKS